MGKLTDLNELRARVLNSQEAGIAEPRDPARAIVVKRDGTIALGDAREAGDQGPLTAIPLEVFAGRQDSDLAVAQSIMPANTAAMRTAEGINGHVYTFRTELGDEFTLFCYFDGANYQVQVVSPKIEAHFCSPHTGHLMMDGRICLGIGYGGGRPTLAAAYAKSVLWANGMSIALRTGRFPFSTNN